MQYFVVVECSDDVEHAVYGLDVGEEGVAKSFSLRSTFDETGNICYLQVCWVHGWGFPEVTKEVLCPRLAPLQIQPIEAHGISNRKRTHISRIWNSTSRLIWFNGAEWIIFRRCTLFRQEIEQTGLAHIG